MDSQIPDAFFKALTSKRLDDPDALVTFYCWYRLYPRWGQTPDHEEMLRFAHACRGTQRHDTMLPFFGAEILCRYLRDSHADPYGYFKRRPEEAQWCIDACLRQATNENACGYARIRAPFVCSEKFANALRRAPKYGFLRFHGDNVRISDITVRMPKNGTLP